MLIWKETMSDLLDYPVPPSLCLQCGYSTDRATNITGDKGPQPDDFTLCLNCGGVMKFGSDLRLMMSTFDAARRQLPPRLLDQLTTAQGLIQRRGPIEKREKPS